mgnify:FL=1
MTHEESDKRFPFRQRDLGARNRLRLVVDIAEHGTRLLDSSADNSDAIQGLVLLDLAVEQALGVAADFSRRERTSDNFRALARLFPEISPEHIIQIHEVRNRAQHQGIPPDPQSRNETRHALLDALRRLFAVCDADFDLFSTVPEVKSPWLAGPLRQALAVVADDANAAAAHANVAYERLFGLAQEVVGWAAIPEEMWVFGNVPRWRDLKYEADCGDGRNESTRIGVAVGAAQVLGISPAAHVRLRQLVHQAATETTTDYGSPDEDKPKPVAAEQARWAIEIVARAAVHIEREWPEAVAVMNEDVSGSAEVGGSLNGPGSVQVPP